MHFLHIYKTGGTALKHALAGAESSTGFALFAHKHSVGLDCIPSGHKVVFVVRDPIGRFVSGFYDRQREGLPRYYTPWSPAEAITFEHFETPNALGEALCGTADQAEIARAAMASLDRINQPLSDWLGRPDYFLSRRDDILLIGRQEQLDADFERLKLLLGLPRDLQLPNDDVDANRAGDVDRRVSARAEAALRQCYADDYAFLDLFGDLGLLGPSSRTVDLAASPHA